MDDQLARLQAALADRYTIERELGRDGMATVYLARDVRLLVRDLHEGVDGHRRALSSRQAAARRGRGVEAGQLTVRLAPQACPKCARTIDAASLPGPKFDEPIPPVPGGLTVCLFCSAILVY